MIRDILMHVGPVRLHSITQGFTNVGREIKVSELQVIPILLAGFYGAHPLHQEDACIQFVEPCTVPTPVIGEVVDTLVVSGPGPGGGDLDVIASAGAESNAGPEVGGRAPGA